MDTIDGILMACDSNIVNRMGDWKTWDGLTLLPILRAAGQRYHAALVVAEQRPDEALFDSRFVSRLALYCRRVLADDVPDGMEYAPMPYWDEQSYKEE